MQAQCLVDDGFRIFEGPEQLESKLLRDDARDLSP